VFVVVGDFGGEAAVDGVEFGEVGVGFDAAAGVDGDDFELVMQVVVVDCAQCLAADAAVAVDGNFDAHVGVLCVFGLREFKGANYSKV